MTAAFNLRTARHVGGAHDDADQISSRATWWDAPGVDISVTLFRRGKAPTPGVPQPARNNPAVKAELARRQAEQRAAERAAARSLLDSGAHHRVLDEDETRVLLRLLTLATEARTVVAGRLATAAGGNDVLTMRLGASEAGSTAAIRHGTLHLPGFELRLPPAVLRPRADPRHRRLPPTSSPATSARTSPRSAVVLTPDVITASRPRPGTLESVLRWADQLARDLREELGYTLIATTRQVRLIRRLDALDPTQATIFTARSGRPFDRRRSPTCASFSPRSHGPGSRSAWPTWSRFHPDRERDRRPRLRPGGQFAQGRRR